MQKVLKTIESDLLTSDMKDRVINLYFHYIETNGTKNKSLKNYYQILNHMLDTPQSIQFGINIEHEKNLILAKNLFAFKFIDVYPKMADELIEVVLLINKINK